jgi:uncharacterized protein (TIGR03435 family)
MLNAVGLSMGDLAANLESTLNKPVVDETRLAARYDLRLLWEEGDTDSLSRALREQAGLTLAPAKRVIDVLVVDRTSEGG